MEHTTIKTIININIILLRMLCSTAGLLLHSHREGPQMCLVALP